MASVRLSERSFQPLLGLLLVLSLPACLPQQKNSTAMEIRGSTMGTYYKVKFVGDAPTEKLQTQIEVLLKDINQQMSTYIPSSEISQFNNSSDTTASSKIGQAFAETVALSLDIAQKTDGFFDPTLGPIVNLWGFGPQKSETVPSDQQIETALKSVGYEKLSLEKRDAGFQLQKKHSSLYLDLSAIAKGFAVDKISEMLKSQDIKNHMVEIGGEIRASGKKGQKPWVVAVESPSVETNAPVKALALNNAAIATSGNYRNFFEMQGRKYGHTIDKKTGRPVANDTLSVSVVHSDCASADAFATALLAMGSEKGLKFAQEQNLAAMFIFSKNDSTLQTQWSNAWEALQ